jgi:SAM-dependent methyltransferase
MSGYVLAHGGDDAGRRRLALLDAFHGPMTLRQLEAAGVKSGWHCLEAGGGSGAMTAWLAERVAPTGHVLAIDIETQWLEPLHGEIVEVRRADITTVALPASRFDLVLARMLLLHLPDPIEACRRFVMTLAPGGQLIIQDADFRPVALQGASDAEAAGLATMEATMRSAGVHLSLGPELEAMLHAVGAQVVQVDSEPSPARGGQAAALITAMTLERFRAQAVNSGASDGAITAAVAALHDPERTFTGPTQWIVRGRIPP